MPHLRILTVSLLFAIFFLIPAPAQAHNLGIDFKVTDDQVAVESYYDDDTPCSNAKIHVERGDKSILTSGRTDKDGHWSFPKPPTGKYTIVVNDGAGHVARSKLTISHAVAGETSVTDEANNPPSRDEFTRFQWQNLLTGLAIIVGGSFVLRFTLASFRKSSSVLRFANALAVAGISASFGAFLLPWVWFGSDWNWTFSLGLMMGWLPVGSLFGIISGAICLTILESRTPARAARFYTWCALGLSGFVSAGATVILIANFMNKHWHY